MNDLLVSKESTWFLNGVNMSEILKFVFSIISPLRRFNAMTEQHQHR